MSELGSEPELSGFVVCILNLHAILPLKWLDTIMTLKQFWKNLFYFLRYFTCLNYDCDLIQNVCFTIKNGNYPGNNILFYKKNIYVFITLAALVLDLCCRMRDLFQFWHGWVL